MSTPFIIFALFMFSQNPDGVAYAGWGKTMQDCEAYGQNQIELMKAAGAIDEGQTVTYKCVPVVTPGGQDARIHRPESGIPKSLG